MADPAARVKSSTHPKHGTTKETESKSLKGAFIAVMTLGALIVLSWLGVFYLFLSRI
ncbi:cytochrome c oxidase subunit 2A [Effusibacillus consociatus]|uniref:Cytochrome c oxidase subunit 2A n=1 Tax=Effusibacillus consociatus TaxID=1117041 RepID=A0ABV9Q360_9BACL